MIYIKDTLGDLLNKCVDDIPDKNFITYHRRNIRWTYREFNDRVDLFAKGLMALGVTKDSKVGIWANNIPDWLVVFFATAKIGAWLVAINTNYKASEIEYVLADADIHTLCTIETYRDTDCLGVIQELVDKGHLHQLKNVIVMDGGRSSGFIKAEEVFELGQKTNDIVYRRMQAEVSSSDVVNMQYTSGTTGFPKGVMLTHFNIVNNGYAAGQALAYTQNDRLLVCVPLFHCIGIVLAACASLTHRMSMVITVDFNAEEVLEAIETEKCTSLYGVPTMFVAELGHENFSKYNYSSLRTGIMAGSLCPVETMNEVMDKMNMREIISVYGLTETSPGMTCSCTTDSAFLRATTVGRPFPGVEVKIVDPSDGHECNTNENGEICCRGYNLMKGYYKNEKATSETIDSDGWLHSGDIAFKDEQGFYHITGRIKDMIIRGGENIYPREIENFIYSMPEVSMVEVVGIPDEKYGEIVGAFVILKEGYELTQEQVREYCMGQIARYKIPKYVFFLKEFPKTGSGKVMKYKLREMGTEMVNNMLNDNR